MKRILLSIVMLAIFGLWANAQVIENFESLKMNLMAGGAEDLSSFTVVPVPDTVGNHSYNCVKFLRDKDGVPWGGFYGTLDTPVDLTANKYVHVMVWKPRISPVHFKFESGPSGSLEIESMYPQTQINTWEEVVFDFTALSGDYNKIEFMPDFLDPVNLTDDIIIYFDNLYVNNDPTVGSAPVEVIENYDYIPLNYMLNGTADSSYMMIAPNPDKSGVNLSDYVIKFLRDKDGYPWNGFWSVPPSVIDVTDNKFAHVKVWKPRVSPIKFKIEGGVAGTIEVESMYPQTKINAWEDIVFDFSDKTGTYPIIAFLPDFADPVSLTDDMVMYFDDIILNNDSNPLTEPAQKISVNMTESEMTPGSSVWISGALGGIYGTWNEPGANPNNEMLDPDGDGIYSITLSLPEGPVAFKFFWGTGWNNGDPALGGDRTLILTNYMDVLYKWGIDGIFAPQSVHWVLNMSYQEFQGNFIEGTDYVDIAGSFNAWDGTNHHLTALGSGLYGITVDDFAIGETIQYRFRINGSWETCEFPYGGPNRIYVVAEGINEISLWYNDDFPTPDFTSDITTLCQGGTVLFEISDLANIIDSVMWNFPGGTPNNSVENTPLVSYANEGDYDVTLTAYIGTNTFNVNKQNYIHVLLPPVKPDKPLGDTTICADQGFSEYNTSNLASLAWDLTPIAAGTVINNGSSYCQIYWNTNFSGEASLKVKAFNICGESQYSDPLLINKTDPISIVLEDEIMVCNGESQMLIPQISGGEPPYYYFWEPPYHFVDPFSPTPIISPLFSDEITLNIVDANNCSKSKSLFVTLEGQNYNLAFTAFPYQFISQPFNVQFDNLTPNQNNYNFIWYFGNGDSSLLVQPNYTYNKNGLFTVTLIAISKLTGCSDTLIKEDLIVCTGAGIGDVGEIGFRYWVDENEQTFNLYFENQPENLIFKLLDLFGKEHFTTIICQRNYKVPLQGLAPGMYLFVLRKEDYVASGKIIISK